MSYFSESVLTAIKRCFSPAVMNHVYLGDSLFFLSGHNVNQHDASGAAPSQNNDASHKATAPALSTTTNDFSSTHTALPAEIES